LLPATRSGEPTIYSAAGTFIFKSMKFREGTAPFGSSRDGADRAIALAREIGRVGPIGDGELGAASDCWVRSTRLPDYSRTNGIDTVSDWISGAAMLDRVSCSAAAERGNVNRLTTA
jgi:hypothetical protein